jgi:cytochrome c oxidase subunit 2
MVLALPLIAGCTGVQSTFSAFGAEAETTRTMTLMMSVGAALIALAVLLLATHAVRAHEGALDGKHGMRLILWAGAVFPTVVLTVLLVSSLPTMRSYAAQTGDLRIHVDGEQFWWRVRYEPHGGPSMETANEVRVPIGRTVAIQLGSPDVIHSFWIPGLAGKVDMIPGRATDLVVRPTRAGMYRGQCAEFCGLSHARMAFDVIAMEPEAFDAWLQNAARPAGAIDVAGRTLFAEYGCDGCHLIRGHVAGAQIGPDLTHYGSRRTLAAGTLPMGAAATSRFIRNPAEIKPGALMPAFRAMPESDARAIAAYLLELR